MANGSGFSPSNLRILCDFRAQVLDKAHEIDAGGMREWQDLAYGYFLGRGKSPDLAWELVTELIRRKFV